MTSFVDADFHACMHSRSGSNSNSRSNNTEFVALSVIYTHKAVAVAIACCAYTARKHLIVRLSIVPMCVSMTTFTSKETTTTTDTAARIDADDEEEEENISTTTTTANHRRMRNVNMDNIKHKSHQRLRRPTLWLHCSKVLQCFSSLGFV